LGIAYPDPFSLSLEITDGFFSKNQDPGLLVSELMRDRTWLLIIIILLIRAEGLAQAIDNTVSFRDIKSDRYTRIFYEDDFFKGTDRDYTQGIYIERVTPKLASLPTMHLLWHPANGEIKYGLAIEDDAYTPNLIDKPGIQYGDRPYAGVLFLKTFLTATNTSRKERISTILSTGIIGQAAGGEVMQKAIHHWIHYTQPRGWPNQIRNDIVLNYQINYEKELIRFHDMFSVAAFDCIRLGTLSTKILSGFNLMLGNFYSPFGITRNLKIKKIQYYFYDQPTLNVMGYDATLEGGLFNHSSPYTIPEKNLNRIVFMNRFGFVIILRRCYFEYFESWNSPEFSTTIAHRSGGFQFSFGF
jgi:lipid A 3-O-deacylase